MPDLLAWFKKHGRHDLPWRQTSDPYHIYVSEIMLQQTQVERVLGKYSLFLDRFPTLLTLAKASDEELLSIWSGLGYYRRVLAMKRCAKECEGNLPREVKELQKLPGIGKYTAHAIASFAYGAAVPVVDVNIERVLRRYFALRGSQKDVWQKAAEFLNKTNPKEHNLALMDLGSLICKADPNCASCPLQNSCLGKDKPLEYWQKGKRSYEKLVLKCALWIEEGKIALTPSTTQLYQNMLVLPQIKPTTKPIATFKHTYTKYSIDVKLFAQKPEEPIVWVALDEIDRAPVPNIVKKALAFVPLFPNPADIEDHEQIEK